MNLKPWLKSRDGPIVWRLYKWGVLATVRWGVFLCLYRWNERALALVVWPKLVAEWLDVGPEELPEEPNEPL